MAGGSLRREWVKDLGFAVYGMGFRVEGLGSGFRG